MAITRGATTNAENASASSVTITKPTCSTGDILIASSSTSASSAAPTLSGTWTVISNYAISTIYNLSLWYRVVDGTEASSFTLTQSAAGRIAGQITVYSGVDTAAPMDLAATYVQATANATSLTHPGVTTRTDGAMVIMAAANDSSTNTNLTNPSGTTQVWENTSSVGKDHLFAEESIAVAGATGSRVWTGGSSALNMGAIHAALKPKTASATDFTGTAALAGSGTLSASGASGAITAANLWVASSTPTSVQVVAKLSGGTNATLRVSLASDLSGATTSSSVSINANGYAKLSLSGLTAATQYYYGITVDGTNVTNLTGAFKTPASAQTSFTFGFASCDNSASSGAFSRILARNPDLFFITGDLGYFDITTNNQASFRTGYETQLGGTMGNLTRQVSTHYIWSDHDFGDNNAVATAPAAPAAQAVYRERVPYDALVATDSKGIYRTFSYGRVRFILTDERSYKSAQTDTDTSAKTVLGATQKQWLKDTITNASEKVIVWVGDVPWTNMSGADDEYANYDTERQELGSFFASSGKNIVRIHGDMHALGADDGTNSPGGIAVFAAAPLYNVFSNKGTYTAGPYPTAGSSNVEQYGFMTVTDAGNSISLAFTGYDTTDTARVTYTKAFSFPSSGTASLSGSGTLSATGKVIAATNLTGAGTLSTVVSVSTKGTAAPSGTGTLSATGVKGVVIGSGAVSGTGTLSATGTPTGTATTTDLSGIGTLSATGTIGSTTATGTAALSSTGTLTASGIQLILGTATLASTGTLSAKAVPNASFSSTGTLAYTAKASIAVGVDAGSIGTLTCVGKVIITSSTKLAGQGWLHAYNPNLTRDLDILATSEPTNSWSFTPPSNT